MDNETKVITLMKEAGEPVTAGEIETASDLDRKAVDKAFKGRCFLNQPSSHNFPSPRR